MNRVLYREWFPQIMYNHHQTGPDGHGDVRAAVPRSVQLQLRSAGHQRHRPGRRGHARALRRREQARRDDAFGLELLDVVERRPAHDAVFPQHDRPAHRDDRQPDADDDSASCPTASCRTATCRSRSRRRSGTSASRSTTPITANRAVLDFAAALPRDVPLQHLPDGQERDRSAAARTPGRVSTPHRRGEGQRSPRTTKIDADRPAHRRRAAASDGAGEVLRHAAAARRSAIRAATSSRRDQARLPHGDEVREHRDAGAASSCSAPRRRSRSAASSTRPARTS